MTKYVAKRDKKKRRVFISHAAEDYWVAKCIERKIAGTGATTFLAENHMTVGKDFPSRIRHAIEDADEFVVYCTPWAIKRPWVLWEMGAAWELVYCFNKIYTLERMGKIEFLPLMDNGGIVDFPDSQEDSFSEFL
ncbi:MAG: toll/interleukin-1 receptor domain-containing protein, partial [Chloroflexi bacterium]|nr:toll/interleukin-1 receptor domain-containing protein [Chloroflexota bacterium]